ncbi:MAG: tetratricopeptide repeat protein [Anaerolineae bacterium]
MLRLPRSIAILMLFSLFLVGFIGAQTNIWIAITLFIFLVGVPMGYFVTVYYMGTAMTVRGDIRGAINHYTRIIKVNETLHLPVNRVFLHTQRAALRNALGDIDGAIADYSAAIQHSKSDLPALYGIRSALYLGKRQYAQALDDSEHVLQLEPDSEIGYANRAAAKMFLGDIDGAIRDCDDGLAVADHLSASGRALLYNNRGTAYRIQGDYAEAMSNYNLALSTALEPRHKQMIHPSVMTNQGLLYYLMQEIENARVYFQQALDTNPAFHKAMAGLAVTRFRLGQASEARKLWKDLIALEPRYRDIRTLQTDMNLPNQMLADISELVEAVRA